MVPRTKLVDVLRQVYAIADEQRLTMMNVFHAGDGNLHPLIVFDAREPGVWQRVHDAGDAILDACVAVGGVLSGEHGIGLEKRDKMPLIFTPDDLDAQARLRDAFDPSGLANPRQGAAAGQPLRRAAARSGGRVGLTVEAPDHERAVDDLPRRRRGRGGRALRRPDPMGGRRPGSRGTPRSPHRPGSSTYDPHELTVTVAAGTPVGDLAEVTRRGRAGVPARSEGAGRHRRRRARRRVSPGTAASATGRCATTCSRCAS